MERVELLHSRQKHLKHQTREHFWTDQEQRHGPDREREGRSLDSSFTELADFLRTVEVGSEFEKKREKVLETLEASTFRYVETRVEFARASISMQEIGGGIFQRTTHYVR